MAVQAHVLTTQVGWGGVVMMLSFFNLRPRDLQPDCPHWYQNPPDQSGPKQHGWDGTELKRFEVKFRKREKCLERFKFKLLTWASIKLQPNTTPWCNVQKCTSFLGFNLSRIYKLGLCSRVYPGKIAMSLLFYPCLIQRHAEPFKTWSSVCRINLQKSFASLFKFKIGSLSHSLNII